MRIIRVWLAILTLTSIFLPQITLAFEGFESNETQINSKMQKDLLNNRIIVLEKKSVIRPETEFEGFLEETSLKDPETEEREKFLAKFEKNKKTSNLPQKKFIVNASAYTASADECGKSDGITASGLMVKEKETIACPPHFPFGTKIKIETMGTYICEDRGGAIKGNHVDIYMKTKKEAFFFGRKNLLAEIVDMS